MKTEKITAKLSNAVPVCLEVNCKEAEQYKNIALLKSSLKRTASKVESNTTMMLLSGLWQTITPWKLYSYIYPVSYQRMKL